MEKDMRFFLAKVKTALRPLSLNGKAAFVNCPDRDFPTKCFERACFGDNWEELRLVKEMWDKNKLFRFAQVFACQATQKKTRMGRKTRLTDLQMSNGSLIELNGSLIDLATSKVGLIIWRI